MKLIKPLLASLTAMVVAAGFALSAQATQISGDIDFVAEVVFDSTSLGSASQVNTWNMAEVSGTSGDFSSIANGTNVSFQAPYVFNPPTAYATLWAVGGFSFNLVNSTVITQSNFALVIIGTGTVSGIGFDTTPGTWSFAVTQSNGGTSTEFSFQGNSTATPTPDSGSTVALLGVALFTVGALRAKFRS
jgi:VPDSG-CTERM motif